MVEEWLKMPYRRVFLKTYGLEIRQSNRVEGKENRMESNRYYRRKRMVKDSTREKC